MKEEEGDQRTVDGGRLRVAWEGRLLELGRSL